MILNLHNCVGCGMCDIVCKIENQVPQGVFLSHHVSEMTGTFPKPQMSYRPIMCNHCEKPACAKVCPTGALHKDEYGLTVVDSEKCTSCGSCEKACPYGAITAAPGKTAADDLGDVKALLKDCTADGAEIQEAVGNDYPMHDPALDEYKLPLVTKGAALKCQMCKHLVYHGDLPRCVEACPAGARIFGDEEDIYGEIHQLKEMYDASVLMPEEGTEPHVYYIREFHKTW